jgi:hypothetical protein
VIVFEDWTGTIAGPILPTVVTTDEFIDNLPQDGSFWGNFRRGNAFDVHPVLRVRDENIVTSERQFETKASKSKASKTNESKTITMTTSNDDDIDSSTHEGGTDQGGIEQAIVSHGIVSLWEEEGADPSSFVTNLPTSESSTDQKSCELLAVTSLSEVGRVSVVKAKSMLEYANLEEATRGRLSRSKALKRLKRVYDEIRKHLELPNAEMVRHDENHRARHDPKHTVATACAG